MILKEATANAFMIRNDGKVFQMLQHIYGSNEEVDETLYAAEWLYSATGKDKTKKLIIDLISSWGYSLDYEGDIVQKIHTDIDSKGYKFLSHEFIDTISKLILIAAPHEDYMALNDLVVNELNQEFLRARYGGMYNSAVGNHEVVFRVSSVGFNWFNIIFNFVYDHKNSISAVTIVKDEESTGFDDAYTHNGKKIFQMPTEEFILLSGNPIIENVQNSSTLYKELSKGSSIQESINYHMNIRRLNERWIREKYKFFVNTLEI